MTTAIPRIRSQLNAARTDFERLTALLRITQIAYNKDLSRNATVPWWTKVLDLLCLIVSLGLKPPPDRMAELAERLATIHQNYGDRIAAIRAEQSSLADDLEKLAAIDHQFVVEFPEYRRCRDYPLNWPALAHAIRERDGYRCQDCHRTNVRLDVHHRRPLSEGGTNRRTNLVTLCRRCHTKRHPHMRSA